MLVKLLTDAPKHNLALMKISAYHKSIGDTVFLGDPQDICDFSYGSWLFRELYPTDISGGVGTENIQTRLNGIDNYKPDYSLYPDIDFSLGYTWEYCPRGCEFCVLKDLQPPKEHNSIFSFLNKTFSKICLLNNNTFTDPQWHDTFGEIWQENLIVVDENGYDLRLLNEEHLEYLNKTRFDSIVHFAFDRIDDETEIRRGLSILKQGIRHPVQIYVLVGYPDWRPIDDTDIDRCKILKEYGFDPFIMVYNRHIKSKSPKKRLLNRFQRMVNRTYIWRKLGFKKAWEEYK